jgi:hypothetical protein
MNKKEIKKVLRKHEDWVNDNGGTRAYLRGADLRGADLTEADLTRADLRGADLTRADLTEADLTRADLRWANLRGANLRGANLRWADLTRANLTEADLTEADLTEADLRWANLRGANLRGAEINWQSHDLVFEILLNEAGDDIEKRVLAGVIISNRQLCWEEFMKLREPIVTKDQRKWVLYTLAKYVTDGDDAPKVLKRLSKALEETE